MAIYEKMGESQRFAFDRLHLAFHTRLPASRMLLRNSELQMQQIANAVDDVVVLLSTWILEGHKIDVRQEREEFLVPTTPWEFWKQLHAPGWFLRFWPVKTRAVYPVVAVHHHYVCPHVDTENPRGDDWKHFDWMASKSGQKR